MTSEMLRNMNPKRSIPIAKIIMIEEISDSDRKYNKKFYGDGHVSVFKVIFERKSLAGGRLEGISQTSEDEEKPIPEVHINEDKKATWYLSLGKEPSF